VIEFWFGWNLLTVSLLVAFTLLVVVPLLFVRPVPRGRLMQRRMWRAAAGHDPSVRPLLAGWRLIRPAEYVYAAVVLAEAAVLAGLVLHQARR
jgi:hypothetical protein